MKKFYLLMAAILLMAMPCVLFAEEQKVEIELIEIVGAGILPGDDPLDDSGHARTNPTQPADFCAAITGRMLAVNVSNSNNTQFYGYTSQQLNASGAHSIEIHNGGLTLVGNFQAQ